MTGEIGRVARARRYTVHAIVQAEKNIALATHYIFKNFLLIAPGQSFISFLGGIGDVVGREVTNHFAIKLVDEFIREAL